MVPLAARTVRGEGQPKFLLDFWNSVQVNMYRIDSPRNPGATCSRLQAGHEDEPGYFASTARA
jgi:hypothetical protein